MRKAETAAQLSLLEHGVAKAIKLPPEWEDLRDDITRELIKARPPQSKLTGLTTVSQKMLTTGAYCVLSIPADNLRQATAATAAQWDENSILRGIGANKPLRFEAAGRRGAPANIRNLLDESDDILTAIAKNAPVGRIPKLWLLGKDAFDKQQIETWPTQALVTAFNEAAGRDDISTKILDTLSKKNRGHVSRQLADLKFPLTNAFIPDETGLTGLKAGALAELNDRDGIATIIVRHGGMLLLKENTVRNEKLTQANTAFAQAPVDFDKVRELALQSLLDQTSAEALNLAGRTYEMQGKPNSAAFFYFQAHVTNSKNPYAATNLALVFDKLGKNKDAIRWLREASKNDRLPEWSKQKLGLLRAKYQEGRPETLP